MKQRGFEKISLEQWKKDVTWLTKPDEFYNEIKLPERATLNSAGYDIFCPVEVILYPDNSMKIPTGFKAYMGEDEYMMIVPRSSMGFKHFMRLANTVAIGDSDYYNNIDNEGHYWIKIRNESDEPMRITKGQAFAQAIFQKYLVTDNDNVGTERTGGLGSTG